MWCWIELVMAWLRRLGTSTWRTRPTNEATSEVMKIPLWAPMMGMTRRSQVSDRSGSMVARGASLRAILGDGHELGADLGGTGGPGSEAGIFIGPRSGPAGRR